MKNYTKSIFRTIKSTMSRFLAIFAIVALGVGFLAGLLASPDDMRLSAEDHYDSSLFFDVKLMSPLGLTDDDISEIENLASSDIVMPVYDLDFVMADDAGDIYTARMHSIPEDRENSPYLNRLTLVSGRMPESPGECVVLDRKSMQNEKNMIGTVLTVDPTEESVKDYLEDSFTVVGTVKSPMYISLDNEYTSAGSGTVDLFVFTLENSFTMDFYTGAYITFKDSLSLNSFKDEYAEQLESFSEEIEALGETRAKLRFEEIQSDAQEELDEARKEYDEQSAKAEKELSDAENDILDAQKQIDEGEELLAEGKEALASAWKELEENESSADEQFSLAQEEIDSGYEQIADFQAQLDAGFNELKSAQSQIDAAYAQLEAAEAELVRSKEELDAFSEQITALKEGKAYLAVLAQQFYLPPPDGTDAGAISTIDSILGIISSQPSTEETAALSEQLTSLKAGLNGINAQGMTVSMAEEQIALGKKEYEQGAAQIKANRDALDGKQAVLNENAASLELNREQLNAQKAQLDSASAELKSLIADTRAQLDEARETLNEEQANFDEESAALEDAKKELSEGREEFEAQKSDAEKKLADGKKEIDDAQAQIDEMEESEWYIQTREDNTGYSGYGSNADKIGAIASVFPLFFFLIAALVVLTTMTRMVEEERQTIGTLKALGYSSFRIAEKYLIYAALAGVSGSIFGILVGMKLFPGIIISAYNIMYDIPRIASPFHAPQALFSSLTAIACTFIATINACYRELRESPAALLRPRAPKAGKRIFLEYISPIWRRMKFTSKVTARNLFRYKKRFFMTVIGISGCTALLVTGFGIRDSISDISSLQFNTLSHYQLTTVLDDFSVTESDEFKALMENPEYTEGFISVLQDSGKVVPSEGTPADNVFIFVPEDISEITEYLTFRERIGGREIEFTADSVIISEKLAERQNIKPGDTIRLENLSNNTAEFTVTGICENYVQHYVYMSPETYESSFNESMEPNALLVKLAGGGLEKKTRDSFTTELLKLDGIMAASFTEDISNNFSDTIRSLNSIVIVIIVCAGLLALVVLYNLTNINITEREKELGTIKVLGFYDIEVSSYIYRETAVLTFIGTAVGLVLGIFLHAFVIRTAEIDMVMFGRSVFPLSYVWSALLTVSFSFLVNILMHGKLKKVSMVESMKAPE